MQNWIPFAEGEYQVDKALLLADHRRAVVVENAIVEIYADSRGRRYLKGRGRIRNILMIELLEESDDLDLLLDFGDEFKYRMARPRLQSGKVFAPDVKSILQFVPDTPWRQLTPDEFERLMTGLQILPDPDPDPD
jgi:hypothetical protein